MEYRGSVIIKSLAGSVALFLFAQLGCANAKGFKDIWTFQNYPHDGSSPYDGLIIDKAGNLYGTTMMGGANFAGAAVKLSESGGKWTDTVLWSFGSGTDGSEPFAGLTADSQGNLYGTTTAGGANGEGTVFEISGTKEKVLYSFKGGSADGASPYGGVLLDGQGNIYGTTTEGGLVGDGAVYKLSSGKETLLWSFGGYPSDGSKPYGGLISDSKGNLYGTTSAGEEEESGIVFELSPKGTKYTETILHTFTDDADGGEPDDGLIMDKSGNLFGTTFSGGQYGQGTVFELAPNGTETVFYSFTGASDGGNPIAGVIADKKGNLYGTTSYAGSSSCLCGTAFKIVPKQNAGQTLFAFSGANGSNPYGGLVADKHGNLYGTTEYGGTTNGVVFELKE